MFCEVWNRVVPLPSLAHIAASWMSTETRSRGCNEIDSIGVNGVHAVVVAAAFVRIQMLRIQRTYDLLITRHSPSAAEHGRRPRLESSVIFHGRRGSLEMDL